MPEDIYTWLRDRQTVTSPSGLSYEVTRLREAADEIDRWRECADILASALERHGLLTSVVTDALAHYAQTRSRRLPCPT